MAQEDDEEVYKKKLLLIAIFVHYLIILIQSISFKILYFFLKAEKDFSNIYFIIAGSCFQC